MGEDGGPVRILGFGTYEVGRHPRIGILLDGLRAHGDEVVEVNVPLGLSTAERVAMLHRPWLTYRLFLRVFRAWARITARALRARRAGPFDAVLVGYLGEFDVLLARLLFPRSTVVLDQVIFAADTARDRGVTGRARLGLLEGLDRMAIRAADVVLVDTDEQLDLIPAPARHKGVVVPVGAPSAWFSTGTRSAAAAGEPLRVVFFGLYTPLQGAEVIGRALGKLAGRADVEVTMNGRGQDYDAARRGADGNEHVRWIDWVDGAALPATVARCDVCLGIFGTTAKALRVVPNKVYQGAAAGCAVVTSDTAPQRRMLGPAAVYVPPGDADRLAAALADLATHRGRVRELGEAVRGIAVSRFRATQIVEPLRARIVNMHPDRASKGSSS
jgi:glycosyltransferase involved in cell wall biosynthesis